MRTSRVADYLRTNKQAISDEWEAAVVADLKALANLERAAIIDHLPEVLDGLAAWVEGQSDEADVLFCALADGHALQRLGFGIELPVVNVEYNWLRRVVLRRLLAVESSPELREDLVRLNEGLDRAIYFSTRRYTERRDYVRDRFVAILGHDLRGPLSAVAMSADSLVQMEGLDDRARKRAVTIARATERMTRMIDDVLDFARGHLGGGIPATPLPCDLGEICRTAIEEVQVAHPQRKIELEVSGDLRGSFDRERVLQAIGNLLHNAVDHGQDSITVRAREADDRAAIFIAVSNAGAIAPEWLPTLFDPFTHSQAKATNAGRPSHGLGLGLYIVAQIVRAHGGTCDVASADDTTTFTLRFPRAHPTEVPNRT